MTTSLRRCRALASRYVAAIGISGAATLASAQNLATHALDTVTIPAQNVCRGQGCVVNTSSYAWHSTQWRRWPGTPTVLPSPGRGNRAETIPPRASFDMPAPTAGVAPSGPRVQGTGVRAPRPTPAVSRPAPPSAGPVDSGVPSDESMPPINLDDILRDEPSGQPKAPNTAPESDEFPPPFNSKGSGGPAPRDSKRTLNALTAGLNTLKPADKAIAPADPWRAAPVRKVNGEKPGTEGPVLNEPNLMSAPDDTAPLQVTPDSAFDTSRWTPANSGDEATEDITMVANWDEAAGAPVDADGGNPLRVGNGKDGRRSNPLRRR